MASEGNLMLPMARAINDAGVRIAKELGQGDPVKEAAAFRAFLYGIGLGVHLDEAARTNAKSQLSVHRGDTWAYTTAAQDFEVWKDAERIAAATK